MMEGLEDELTCPVCLELFTCPLQLSCNHNLCRRCAEVLLQTETDPSHDDEGAAACSAASPEVCSATGAPRPENKPDSFTCPTCREEVNLDTRGLDGLRKNLLLQNIVDRFMTLKTNGDTGLPQIPCQLCKTAPPKMAAKSCLVCKASYCDQCLTLTHPAFPPFTDHELVDPRTSFEEAVMCPEHRTKPVEMYCVQDQTLVCLLCAKVGRHKDHNMAALEEVFSQRRADLQAEVDRLGAWIAQGEEKTQKLQEKQENVETRAGDIKARVAEECDALHEVIRQRRTEMNRKVELASQADKCTLQREVDKTKDDLHKARSSLAYAQEALKETDPASFLQAAAAVMAKLGGTVDVAPTGMEYSICEVDDIKIDLSQTKEMLEIVDIGALPKAPVIVYQNCSTTVDAANIEWQPHDEALEYDVRYKTGTVEMTAIVKDRSFTAKSLSPGTKYKFEIRSKNKNGTSHEASIELSTKSPPEGPTILSKMCSTTTDEARIEWQPKVGAYEYEVRYTIAAVPGAATHSRSPHACQGATATSNTFTVATIKDNKPLFPINLQPFTFTAKQLTPSTKYRFEVRSKSTLGTSKASRIELVTQPPFQFQVDPNTADKRYVRLSEGNRRARYDGDNVATFLGNTPITSGRHYWEVSVDSTEYSVGVAYGDIPKGKDIRKTSKSWAFDRDNKTYTVQYNSRAVFEKEWMTNISRIGVLVDHNPGQLSFYNADTQTLIYTLRPNFTQPLYPAFSLWNGSIRIHCGLVCPFWIPSASRTMGIPQYGIVEMNQPPKRLNAL